MLLLAFADNNSERDCVIKIYNISIINSDKLCLNNQCFIDKKKQTYKAKSLKVEIVKLR